MAGILNAQNNIAASFPELDQYGPNTTLLLHGDGTNGAQNNTFLDSSTNNFTITRNGNTTQGTFSPFSQPNGYWSNYFNGTTAYLSFTSNATAIGTGDFTIETWICPGSQPSTASTIIGGSVSGTPLFNINGTGTATTISLNSYGSANAISASITFTIGVWYHIAVSRSGTSLRLFVNGSQVASATNSTNFTQPIKVIGSITNGQWYAGYVSNARVVVGTAVYTSNFTPPTTPLTAITNTNVLTCQSNRFVDNSTNAFAITPSGTPSVQSFKPFSAPTAYYPAVNGGGAYFDGSGDYLTAPYYLNVGTGSFTVEGWFYITSFASNQCLWYSGNGQGATAKTYLYVNTSGNVSFAFQAAGGTAPIYQVNIGLQLNQWLHIACVKNGTTLTIYLNGASVATATGVSASVTGITNPFYIGYSQGADGDAVVSYMNGYCSNLRVNTTAVYTSNFTPPTSPLTAITNTQLLLSCTNAGIIDSVSQNQLETVGNAQVSTTQSKFGGASMYFDGTGDYLFGPASNNFTFGSSGDFTIELWMYQSSTPAGGSNYQIVNNIINFASNYTNCWGIYCNSSNYLVFYDSAGGNAITSSLSITNNIWTHVAVCRNSSTITMYINGNSVGSYSGANQAFTKDGTLGVGGSTGTSGSYFFPGYIDDLRITKGIARYTQNFTPPQNAYPNYGPLTNIPTVDPNFKNTTLLLHGNGTNGAQNNTFLDSSTNNFTITRNGNTTQGTFTPFSQPNGWWSNYFNGSSDYLTIPATSAFTIATSSTPFTVEAWVYLTSEYTTYNNCLFTNSYTGSTVSLVAAFTTSAGFSSGTGGLYPAFGFYSGFWNTAAVSTTPIKLNTWTHVAFVFTGSTSKVYINGSDVTGSTVATSWGVTGATGRPWYIGYKWDGPVTFNGYISNLRFVNGTAVYTSNFTPTNYPLTAISNTALLTNQSNRFVDNSTNALTLTPTGTPTVQNFYPFFPPLDYSTAAIGGSAYFDGSGDYLTVPDNAALELGTNNFTIECWVYPLSFSGTINFLIGKMTNSTTASGFLLRLYDNTGVATFYASSNGSSWDIVSGMGTVAPPLNAWSHIAVSRSGSSFRIWVNGVSGGTATSSGSIQDNTSVVGIGAVAGGGGATNGYIANARIVNGTAVYDPSSSTLTVPTSPLTAITNTSFLLSATNAGIFDNASKNDLETVGNAQISTTQSKFGGSSMKFNGSTDYLNIPASQQFVMVGDYTIEFWMYFSAGNGIILDQWVNSTTGQGNYNIYIDASNKLYFYYDGNSNINYSTALSQNQWYHVAATRYGSNIGLYVNGNLVSSTTGSSKLGRSDTTLWIGAQHNSGPTNYFNGYLDDFRITSGICRYPYNFTPPIAQFPNK